MTTFAPFEILVTPQMTNFLIHNPRFAPHLHDGRDWPKKIEPSRRYTIGRWIDATGWPLRHARGRDARIERSALLRPPPPAAGVRNQSIFKGGIFLDRADPNILNDEITTIDSALTHPWTVTKQTPLRSSSE